MVGTKLSRRALADFIQWITRLPKRRSNLWTWIDTRAMGLPGTIESNIKEGLLQFFEGRYQKKTLFQRMFPLGAGIYAGFFLLAWLLFPGGFSLATNTISDLGNPVLNPTGYWCFSTAFTYLALFNIPFYRFVHKRLAPLSKMVARVALLSNLVASGGFIVMATFPNIEETIAVHVPAAVVSFGGLVLGGLIYWAIIVKDAILKTGTRRIIPLMGALTNIAVGIAVFQLFDFTTFSVKPLVDTALAPWEWTLFFSIGANMLMLFRSVPEIEMKSGIYRLVEEQKYCAPEDVMRILANRLPDKGDCMDEDQEFCFGPRG